MEGVIGLYGCYCHPFVDWKEHDKFLKQKLLKGTIVKVRCTGEFAEVVSVKSSSGFIDVFVFPQDCARCLTIAHVSNLIQFNDFCLSDKLNFLKNNQLKLF